MSRIDKALELVPDFQEVQKVYNSLVDQFKRDTDVFKHSQKKRPVPLLLAVIQKYQRKYPSELGKYARDFDPKSEVAAVCARCWNYIETVERNIRNKVSGESPKKADKLAHKNIKSLAKDLKIEREDILMTYVTEQDPPPEKSESSKARCTTYDRMGHHCPDFAVFVDVATKSLVLCIPGTRVFPTPKIHDVIMDLMAMTTPFLGGEAHEGMVIGTLNMLKKTMPCIMDFFNKNPDFSLLIVGYSLGAAVAQLIALDMMRGEASKYIDVPVRAVCFGAPPVFKGLDGEQFKEILIVQNNQDGIISASLRSVNDLFLKAAAIDATDIETQTLMNMAIESTPSGDSQDSKVREEGNKFMDGIKATYSQLKDSVFVEEKYWDQVGDAMSSHEVGNSCHLRTLGKNILLFQNNDGKLSVQVYTGKNTSKLINEEVKLSSKMYMDHMPWGYEAMFGALSKQFSSTAEDPAVIEQI